MQLTEGRPLVFFDLETTGTNILTDRIVEISTVKIHPDGTRTVYTRRVNPEMHIPEEASAVHHIYDSDVANEAPFSEIAPKLFRYLENCDLGGYNVSKFDIPVLTEEFRRAGINFSAEGRRVVDPYVIFCKMEPRNLTAAYRFFCGKKMEDAHSAEADILATLEVYEGEISRYENMSAENFPDGIQKFPQNIDEMHSFCIQNNPGAIDKSGRFKWREKEAVIAFGRHNGKTLREVSVSNPDFLKWIIRSDFPADTKEIARNALKGVFPEKKS